MMPANNGEALKELLDGLIDAHEGIDEKWKEIVRLCDFQMTVALDSFRRRARAQIPVFADVETEFICTVLAIMLRRWMAIDE